jgi:hypothetical protein
MLLLWSQPFLVSRSPLLSSVRRVDTRPRRVRVTTLHLHQRGILDVTRLRPVAMRGCAFHRQAGNRTKRSQRPQVAAGRASASERSRVGQLQAVRSSSGHRYRTNTVLDHTSTPQMARSLLADDSRSAPPSETPTGASTTAYRAAACPFGFRSSRVSLALRRVDGGWTDRGSRHCRVGCAQRLVWAVSGAGIRMRVASRELA